MLEGRAAAREEAGRTDEALHDANRMLKVERANPRVSLPCFEMNNEKGYICMGGLLEKKRKFKSAMNCYEYGLKKCSESHDTYKVSYCGSEF